MEASARPGMASQDDTAGTARQEAGRQRLWAFLELFALVGFAIAQPTLDVLGKSPDFFIFRQADRLQAVAIDHELVDGRLDRVEVLLFELAHCVPEPARPQRTRAPTASGSPSRTAP